MRPLSAPPLFVAGSFTVGLLVATASAATPSSLPSTGALAAAEDRSAAMVAGLHRHLDALTAEVAARRAADWDRRATAGERASLLHATRAELARIIGAMDQRATTSGFELVATPDFDGTVAGSALVRVHAVRWPVFENVRGEGLLLLPSGEAKALVVALPDADQTPEVIAGLAPGLPEARHYARRLAESGCAVLVPMLLSRADADSGNPAIGRMTNQPHREWIYRQAFALGRHPVGLEVQTIGAGIDALLARYRGLPVGVAGWGEGGLLAFLAAALDERIGATVVSGYFGPRELLHAEPIYRNLFGLLRVAGDAEIAQLVLPRTLIIESSDAPRVDGPPPSRNGATGAAPGVITTPAMDDVEREFARARRLAGPAGRALISTAPARDSKPDFMSDPTLRSLLTALVPGTVLAESGSAWSDRRTTFSPQARQSRLVRGWQDFLQSRIAASATEREDFLWKKISPKTPDAWAESVQPFRATFHESVIGRSTSPKAPPNVRSRFLKETEGWTMHEVVLDVASDLFAWGYLLVPKGIAPGERRPAVVAQHGLEGMPAEVVEEDPATRAFGTYKAFAVRLVERGFVVFAPHNPYRGPDFRQLQRKAHPLGLSLFSFITAQHESILDWLGSLPQVDSGRIGFYGLSYGGSTAMRVPAVLTRYAAVVCSGNFNEWVWKLSTTSWPGSYVFTREYEMPEFNLAGTFNHAEMAALIAPRPFMVERGHVDGVGTDEWVSFEYAKVRRLYERLGIPDRTTIEYFNGPHTIHGVGSYAFLHRHLRWPEPGR